MMMINHIMCTLKILADLWRENVLIKFEETIGKIRKRNNWVWKLFQTNASLFKIFADFEFNLRGVESYESSYTREYQDHFPCSFAYKVVCIDERFTKPTVVVYRGENVAYEFIKIIFKEYRNCKKVFAVIKIWSWVKKKNIHFNKVTIAGFVKNLLTMMKKK